MKYSTGILLIFLALTMIVQAQQTPATSTKVLTGIVAGGSGSVVKGAPYSAEAISESVQTLADGNRITRSNTTRIFRDSEGRVRREGSSSVDGNGFAFVAGSGFSSFGFQDSVSIFDPVSNIRYALNPTTKIARRQDSKVPAFDGTVFSNGLTITSAAKAQIDPNAVPKALAEATTVQRSQIVALPYLSAVTINGNGIEKRITSGKSENLGTREIEGVMAEGRRLVSTIPAGAIGNERPIETVYESWYSKELQMIILSVHTDPRWGEQTYRLTNINRSEPDRSLFAPPADYKIVKDSTFNFVTTKPQ